MKAFINARIIFPDKVRQAVVITNNGTIIDVCERFDLPQAEVIDCHGNYLSPGFADIHVHGGGGCSAMSENYEDIITMCEAHAYNGTTSIVPTTLASPVKKLQSAMSNISKAMKCSKNSNILGIHLEGPFLSLEMKGAQSPENIFAPDCESVEQLLDFSDDIIMMGAAPESDGGLELGKEIITRGIVASIAHSNADFSTIEKALKYGYTDVTHLYCACSMMHKIGVFRQVGVVEAAYLFDELTTQFIADLRHLPEGALRLIYKIKGADKAYVITDGLEYSAFDIAEGTVIMQENGQAVLYEDEVMKLADRSCLAGSTATCSRLVRNLISVGIPLTDAVKMATLTPLSVIGFDRTKGKIAKGYDADIIVFDENINIKAVAVNGNLIRNELT